MKRAVVAALCFILSIFADTCLAAEATRFGPKQYVRTSGPPNVFAAAFAAISGTGMLIVKNGAMDGKGRISSASVYVNGEHIFGPGDFNQKVDLLQAPVNLTESNAIAIELASRPGSCLTIEVTQDQQQNQAIDLEPVHLAAAGVSASDGSLKTFGQTVVTVANRGSGAVTGPYRIVVFEDVDQSGGYEAGQDNRLGEKTVTAGPDAGESADIIIDVSGRLTFRDNRLHASVDSADEVEESDEGNNVIATAAPGIDLSASPLYVDAAACPAEIRLTVRVGNAGDQTVAAGVPVSFYDGEPGTGGALIATLTTPQSLAPGQYADLALQWPDPPDAATRLYARVDDGGAGDGTLDERDETNNLALSATAGCTLPETPAGGISGQVIDALTGGLLAGATVSLYAAQDGIAGALIDQATSIGPGGFLFSAIAPGSHVLMAESQGYVAGTRRVDIAAGEALARQDVVLSPVLASDEIRIVLTWGPKPADLEAHLTGPNPDGCRHHCYYWNREIPGARLDIDATHGFGPETITLSKISAGVYRYYVHDFTDRLAETTNGLAASGARVDLIFGDGRDAVTFEAPAESGSVWHVFDLDGTSGAITPVNRMGCQDEPGKIDFPTIVSTPPRQIQVGSPFTYTVQAIDPDIDTLLFRLPEAPEGMVIDPLSGRIDWTPASHQAGAHPVSVSVTDPHCGEDTQQFNLHALVDIVPAPSASFSVSPCTGIDPGGEITLTWSTNGAASVEIDNGIGEVSANGQLTLPSPAAPVTYTLRATNAGGTTIEKVPTITNPLFTICALADDGQYEFAWNAECAIDCRISPIIGSVACSGSKKVALTKVEPFTLAASNPACGPQIVSARPQNCTQPPTPFAFDTEPVCQWEAGGSLDITWSAPWAVSARIEPDIGPVAGTGSITVTPSQPTTYTLTATNSDGYEFSRSVAVPRYRKTLFNHAYAGDPVIMPGQSTELIWAAIGCADSCMIDHGIGSVDTQGSVAVTPDQLPRTYTITVLSGGLEVAARQITVRAVTPTISFGVSPAVIKPGDAATLSWQTADATTCRIDPGIGAVATSGSITVAPQANTTYTLIAEGPGGSQRAMATVVFVQPTAAIQADPETILPGESATLTWVFSNADACVIEPGIGAVELGGSAVVHPLQTTTYTITATGPGGRVSDSVTVALPAPTVSISADPPDPGPGDRVTLVWQSSYADACTISPDIGSVDPQGAVEVTPVGTVTYTIHASGPGGHATAQTTITCGVPELQFSATPQSVHAGEPVTLAWSSTGTANCMLSAGIGEVPPQGTLTVHPERDARYVLSSTGCGGTVEAEARVSILCRPQATLLEPDGIGATANTVYAIRWTDSDCDDDAVISLFYDDAPDGEDGILIATGISEDPDGPADYFAWDTSQVPAGEYYLYLSIQDGTHEPVVVHGGAVTIDHSLPVLKETKLVADFGVSYDVAPAAIDIEGDTAIVGYRGHGACIYTINQGQWVLQQKIACPDETFANQFGASVGISKDYAVVGSSVEFSFQGEDPGSAYIFHRENGRWTFQSELIPSEAGPGLFGSRVAIDGDMAVVASGGIETYMGTRAPGRAFVFMRENDAWVERQKLMPGDSAEYDYFGAALDIDQEVMIIGADRSQSMGSGIGSAYVFRHANGLWRQEAMLSDATAGTHYGSTVAISGGRAIVGAPRTSESAWCAGAAHAYARDPLTGDWQQTAILAPADPTAGDYFGHSVALDGDFAVIGAYGKDLAGSGAGAAYLYKSIDGTWLEALALTAGDARTFGDFGKIVALDNGMLLVSSGNAAYLYEACSAALVADPPYIAPGAQTTLRWHSVLAGSCTIEPGIGAVEPSGSMSVSPPSSTAYTIHAVGEFGAAVQTARVEVGTWRPIAEILADTGSITIGESALIVWNTRYANSVSIEPDIGAVDACGSMTVSPTTTTTYLITAVGPGGTTTARATVTVTHPAPTATINADPATIVAGASSTLTWSSTNADSAQITPGIGTVDPTGTAAVSPTDTTTYTITVTGPGGTATSTVTVTVLQPPTVTLSATPDSIALGASATLSWSSTHADTCTIDQGIGAVAPSGSTMVSPTTDTTYAITATGPGGTATETVAIAVVSPITLQILSPTDGATLYRPDTMVHGIFTNTAGTETGITVNGQVAMVYGNEFVINHLPLEEGANTITVVATDIEGYTQTATAGVTTTIPEHYIRIYSAIEAANVPLEAALRIDGTFSIDDSALNYTGPGTVDLIERGGDAYRVGMIDKGIYFFTAQVVHEMVTYTDTIAIVVVDVPALDTLLQQKWADMKTALISGNIELALQYHHERSHESYSAIYTAIGSDLPTLVSQMQGISLIYCVDGTAKYRIRQDHDIDGQIVTISYYVYFIRDDDGLWRIEKY